MTNRTANGLQKLLRSRALRSLAALTIASPLFFAARPAQAQEWLKDRRAQEGAGIRTGDLELHPGIGAEVGYDSNYFLRTSKEGPNIVNGAPQQPPVDTGLIRITPSLTLRTLSGQRIEGQTAPSPIAFTAGIAATYREFLSKSSELRDQRNVSGNVNARLDINQGRPIGAGIWAGYTRTIQPSVVANPDLAFNRSDVNAGAEVVGMPGGGTFDIRAAYQFFGGFFEEQQGVPYTNFTHELSVRNRWRFRPRTALFSETSLSFVTYPDADRAVYYLNSSTPIRTKFGVTGLVTERFGVLLSAGYASTFFEKPDRVSSQQYDSITAQAEGTFYLSHAGAVDEPGKATLLLSTLSIGFLRDFQTSLLGNYYTSNKGYAKVLYMFGGRVLASLNGYVEGQSYPQPFANDTDGTVRAVTGSDGNATGDFTNLHVGGTLFVEYRFSSSFALNGTVDYSQVVSDVQLDQNGPPPAGGPVPAAAFYDLSWQRVQATLGARYFF